MFMAVSAYGGLFILSFLAATLVPGSSEAALGSLLLLEQWEPVLLLTVASFGNILGSVFNWYCGRFLVHFRDRSWFPVTKYQYEKAVSWFLRYGQASILLAWVPIIGDPLTVVAGGLCMKFKNFLILVSISKIMRYVFVYWAVVWWQEAWIASLG